MKILKLIPIKRSQTLSKDHIGWTAFYTAAVWAGLGVPGARPYLNWRGRLMRWVVEWGGATLGLFGRYSVTNLFLAPRHRGIDYLLEQAGPVQVVELAAGLASRGYELTRQRACRYIEVDQAAVIEFKRQVQAQDQRPAAPGAVHSLLAADLLQIGATELADLLKPHLDPTYPVLIIAEGLTGYLGELALAALLAKLHALAAEFAGATLWLDFYLRLNRAAHGRVAVAMAPARLFWRFLRAPMRMFLRDEVHLREFLEKQDFRVSRFYSAAELAKLTGHEPPLVNLFFLATLSIA